MYYHFQCSIGIVKRFTNFYIANISELNILVPVVQTIEFISNGIGSSTLM